MSTMKQETCSHPRVEHLITEGGAALGQRCGLCLAVWAMRACDICRAEFRLRDGRSLRRRICASSQCRKTWRNAHDRARRRGNR